jgi:hypothetical protein
MFVSATLTEFLGWSLVINVGVFVFVSVSLILMRSFVTNLHGKMFGLSETDLSRAYFQYLANYKLLIMVFNLAPYIDLKMMS